MSARITEGEMKKQLESLEELCDLLKRMLAYERVPTSESCHRIQKFMEARKDPLVAPVSQSENPFYAKQRSRKGFLCC